MCAFDEGMCVWYDMCYCVMCVLGVYVHVCVVLCVECIVYCGMWCVGCVCLVLCAVCIACCGVCTGTVCYGAYVCVCVCVMALAQRTGFPRGLKRKPASKAKEAAGAQNHVQSIQLRLTVI